MHDATPRSEWGALMKEVHMLTKLLKSPLLSQSDGFLACD